MEHGMWKELGSDFETALAKIPDALAAEGFGIITQIDMQATVLAKIGEKMLPYRIIGACNPKLAHQAVQHDPRIGLLLPCNVVLYQRDDGKAVLGAIDPMQSLGAQGGALGEVAQLVKGKLERFLASMS
jgi:uncharacterized protein (DUF302 family)